MEYRSVKELPFALSSIALGTWAIGGSHWDDYDESRAVRAIETALDKGVNFIDTAPVYGDGHSEELIGKILRGRRDKVFLATKCGLNIYSGKYERDLSAAYIEKDLTESLKRLGTDYIDLYQCHWPDPQTPIAETMETLMRFRKEGKIRFVGVSNFSDQGLREAAEYGDLFSLQSHYSLLERGLEKSLLSTCRERGIHVLSYGPLGAGMLTGKYTECPRFSRGDARSFFYRFFKPRYWQRVRGFVDALSAMAETKGVRPCAIAISWVLAQEGILSAIVGARSPEQVLENITHVPVTLADDELALLDSLSRKIYVD
jgi:methylglyoxal reductase